MVIDLFTACHLFLLLELQLGVYMILYRHVYSKKYFQENQTTLNNLWFDEKQMAQLTIVDLRHDLKRYYLRQI
jgi:hypothetical protein